MDFGFLDSKLSDADHCLHEMYRWESRSDDRMNHWPRNHESFLRLCEIVRDLFERRNQERGAEIKAWKARNGKAI